MKSSSNSQSTASQTPRRRKTGSVIPGLVSIGLIIYLVVALNLSGKVADDEMCTGLRIAVNDTASFRFVTPDELAHELGTLPGEVRLMRLRDINTDSIEQMLASIDKIEDAEVVRLSDGEVLITVNPMHPVARIFDGNESYYINRKGKKISATARYHVDVPLILGHFNDSVFPAIKLLPLVDYITADSLWNSFISMIKVDSPTDVLLVPIVRGQIINIGEPRDFDDKFTRLKRTYREVLPVKGWNFYDTISVKWAGQIVATRRHKQLLQPRFLASSDDEADDVTTMQVAENIAPGQALPGKKAKNDRPIPADRQANNPTP